MLRRARINRMPSFEGVRPPPNLKNIFHCPLTQENTEYLVLGAGSAGCVVARRLSDAGHRVTLMEAGPSDRQWDWWKAATPAALTYNLDGTKYNWDFWTTPQKHLNGRQIHQPRGKGLGGSSSLNAMVYIRGHPFDFDGWGVDGWAFKDCLPYFKKAQKHQAGGDSFRGGKGLLEVTRRRSQVPAILNEAFVTAGVEAGYGYTEDMNGCVHILILFFKNINCCRFSKHLSC